jgi:hypothetical protein
MNDTFLNIDPDNCLTWRPWYQALSLVTFGVHNQYIVTPGFHQRCHLNQLNILLVDDA